MTIRILGDPNRGLQALSEALQTDGSSSMLNGTPQDGAVAIFAVSGQEGLSHKTLDVLDAWNGTRIHLLAIVVTDASPGIDPDQLEMVFCEARHQIFPAVGFDELADAVPFLKDGLPDLSQQIRELKSAPPPAFPVDSDKADYLAYVAGMSQAASQNTKPWWKFW